ncbi:MAG: energy transducer TonB [Aquificae bacterium]|nr:energy transducer TonB [Aquificota bacterium]
MGKNLTENVLYFMISLLINLLFIKLLYVYIFSVNLKPPESPPPLRVEIKHVKPPPPPPPKKEKPARSAEEQKRGEAPPSGAVSAHPKGDVPVAEQKEESVSILPELEKRIRERLAKRAQMRKEVGEISAVVGRKSVKIKSGTRKLVYIPPAPVFTVKEFPSQARIKIWVSPEGKVIRAVLLQRSGVGSVDEKLIEFVRKLRFEPIEEPEVQEGVITFRFAT